MASFAHNIGTWTRFNIGNKLKRRQRTLFMSAFSLPIPLPREHPFKSPSQAYGTLFYRVKRLNKTNFLSRMYELIITHFFLLSRHVIASKASADNNQTPLSKTFLIVDDGTPHIFPHMLYEVLFVAQDN